MPWNWEEIDNYRPMNFYRREQRKRGFGCAVYGGALRLRELSAFAWLPPLHKLRRMRRRDKRVLSNIIWEEIDNPPSPFGYGRTRFRLLMFDFLFGESYGGIGR